MVTNRVFKVLATNGTQMANMADTGTSEYLIIKEDGSTVEATTALDREDKVTIVVNSPNGGKVFSDKIRIGDITSYETQTYAAKTEQVITITPETPVAGNEYTLSVIDKSDKEILQCRQNKRTYSVIAATGETATTLGDKFRTLINADTASVVAATGTTTIVLTAKSVASTANIVGEYPAQYFFDVTFTKLDPTVYPIPYPVAGGTIAYTTAPAFGSGQFYQVRTLELKGLGYTSVTNRIGFPIPTGNFTSVSGTNYDIAVIEDDNRHDTNVVVEGEKRAPRTTIIACTNGSSTGLFAILARLAGSGDQAATA